MKPLTPTDRYRVEIKYLGQWWRLEEARHKLLPEALKISQTFANQGDETRIRREKDGAAFP